MSIFTRDAASVCLTNTSLKQLPVHLSLQLCPYVPLLHDDIKYKHHQKKLKAHTTKPQSFVFFNSRIIWFYQYPFNDVMYLFSIVLFFAILVHILVH